MVVSDDELMIRLAKGEDPALNELMDRWGGRVAAFLHRMTGQRETGADLAQETFVKLYQFSARYQAGGNFSSYLFSIAANLARNHARWKSRHPTVAMDAAPDEDAGGWGGLRAPGKAPDEAAQSAEKCRAVHAALLRLPADLREAMSLFVEDGLGYAEIATVAQCSHKAVETRIYRARQILREQLSEFTQ